MTRPIRLLKRIDENIVDETTGEDYIRKVSTSLGIGTNGVFGWTINIPTHFMVKCMVNNKRIKLRWEFLTPSQQFVYYRDIYLPFVCKGYCNKFIAVPELTTKGNMHLHLLCQSDIMVNDYDLWSVRKSVLQNNRVLEISRGNPKHGRHLNYIHFLVDVPQWRNYLGKDLKHHEFPIFTYNEDEDI